MVTASQIKDKHTPRDNRISTQLLQGLPRGWRIMVSESLLEVGITCAPQTITNLLNGRHDNPQLLLKVIQTITIVKQKREEARRQAEALLSG